MLHEALVYEERYHWTRTSISALTVCCVLVLCGIAVPLPLPLRVVIIAVCGYGAFLSVVVPASRKVALRIDASGITLGGSPLRYRHSPLTMHYCQTPSPTMRRSSTSSTLARYVGHCARCVPETEANLINGYYVRPAMLALAGGRGW